MNSNCLFIDIIGSIPDENENSNKIYGYYQVTSGILIKDLVIKLFDLSKEQVKIFAYGDKLFYDLYIHTNYKCYYQFGLKDVFQMNFNSNDLVFKYFFDFNKILLDIDKIIEYENYTSIILFLNSHGSKGKLSKMNYFQLYQIFLKYPECYFLVFNDSCFSGSLIELIKMYKKIYELKIEKEMDDKTCIQLVFSFTKLFKYILKKIRINDPINEVKDLINFYQTNKIADSKKFKDLLILINSNDKSVEKITKIGFKTAKEVDNFQIIYNSFHFLGKLEKDDNSEFMKYIKSLETFTAPNLELIIDLINGNLQEFINVIDILDASKENINFQLPPSQNVEVITSTDDISQCFSYTSIRINSVTKVYPGTPFMSEIIKGLFLTYDKNPINFNNIEKEICGIEEKAIYHSVRVQEKSPNGHIKKEWANLFPQHYTGNSNSFSITISEEQKKRITALRAISFIISSKSTEIARKLLLEIDPCMHNIINDTIADMVAIAAIINEDSNIKEILNNSINGNKYFKKNQFSQTQLILPIIEFAFYSSKDKLQMMAVIMNCINEAIIKEINKSIESIGHNYEFEIPLLNFILKNEIQYFKSNQTSLHNINDIYINSNEEEKNNVANEKDIKKSRKVIEFQKLEVINEVINAIFALLKPSSTFFAYLIASSILDDINIESIKTSAFITNSSKKNKYMKKFIENENLNKLKEIKFRKLAENCLFQHVKLSLDSFSNICDMHIKNDAMKIVVGGIQTQNSIFLMKILAENIIGDCNTLFIDNIINPIEKIIALKKIPTYFIPAIIEFLPPKEIIYALYSSLTYLHDNWYDCLINTLKSVIKNASNNSMNCQYINEESFLQLVFDALEKQKDIHDKTIYEAEVQKNKENYIKEIDQSLKKIIKLIEISVKRVRGNISRMMNMEILKNRLNYCSDFCEQIEENSYQNKFHKYLYLSISEFIACVNSYMNKATIDENIKEEFDYIELLKNTNNLYMRAAKELNTISYLFSISDESLYEFNKELSKIIESDQINLQVSVMFARALNIVEMSPIPCLLKHYSKKINQIQITKPNIKELMGLLGANIFILTPKDEMRKKIKVECLKRNTKKDNEGKLERYFDWEYDNYYSSDDDDFDNVPYRPTQKKSGNGSPKAANNMPKKLWHKDQISQIIIRNIQTKLKIGSSSWVYDAWIAYIYCFNERMKDIKLKFDPDDDYENDIYYFNIDEAKKIIESFYPLYRVIDFWKNESKIQLFIGKNTIHSKETLRAMIRSFDDADRIVTPVHMFRETYEERTSAILNRIYSY